MSKEEMIKNKYEQLKPLMNERMRRLWAATEAESMGHGGIGIVAKATGLTRKTIWAGMQELGNALSIETEKEQSRVRRNGGGRKAKIDQDEELLKDLEALIEPLTRGDPQSPLRWTCKSTYKLAAELTERGHPIGPRTVAKLLKELKYGLQANQKTKEGSAHPDRNAQFEHINKQTIAFQQRGQPVISVDTKKKELVGEFKNGGREWHPQKSPEKVKVHDFPDKELGKAIPYGVYDLTNNRGWVSVGSDHDTAAFAVETIRRWWYQMGQQTYSTAIELLITADGGGSNGSRTRLWKIHLQQLADETGLQISVCHFPPGTSKWNKIEHRMFSAITQNWRSRPLVSHEVVVNLISNTTTQTGLRIEADLDTNLYPTGIKVTDDDLAQVCIKPHSFHGEWNYTIVPKILFK